MLTDIVDDCRMLFFYIDQIPDVGERFLAQEALKRLRYKAEFNLDSVLKRLKVARIAKMLDDDLKDR